MDEKVRKDGARFGDAADQIRSDRGDPWVVGWLETRANTLDPS